MSYNFLLYAFSILLGSWIALVVRAIQSRRRINILEASLRLKELDTRNTFADGLARLGKAASDAGVGISSFTKHYVEDYPDKDGDGVPDAFQRRKPLSELLEFDKKPAEPGEPTSPGRISFNPNEYWIAVELPARPPRKYEYFIIGGEIVQSTINYSDSYKAIIVKQTRNCRPEDLVELSK